MQIQAISFTGRLFCYVQWHFERPASVYLSSILRHTAKQRRDLLPGLFSGRRLYATRRTSARACVPRQVRPSAQPPVTCIRTSHGGTQPVESKVLEVLVNAGKPLRPGDIAKELGVDSKEVSKAIAELKKEGKVMSPKRCYYAPAE